MEQECIPVRCVPSAAVAAASGVYPSMHRTGGCMYPSMHWAGRCVFQHHWAGGCVYPSMHWAGDFCPGGVSALGVSVRGVSVRGAWGRHNPPVQCMLGSIPLPPWTEFLTHACENITFPQLLLGTAINKFEGIIVALKVKVKLHDGSFDLPNM